MGFDRIYVDTNVFVRAFESAADDEIAATFIGALGLSFPRVPPAFVTSQLTLAELLVHPFRLKNDLVVQRYTSLLAASSPWLQIGQVSRSILVGAARLRAHNRLKLPDAIHVATAIRMGCSHFLSADADIEGLTDLHEQNGKPARLDAARPDLDTLNQIVAWLKT